MSEPTKNTQPPSPFQLLATTAAVGREVRASRADLLKIVGITDQILALLTPPEPGADPDSNPILTTLDAILTALEAISKRLESIEHRMD